MMNNYMLLEGRHLPYCHSFAVVSFAASYWVYGV